MIVVKNIRFNIVVFFIFSTISLQAQVQRAVLGTSVIRENIIANAEFHFYKDWTKMGIFKSGIGESIEIFPIIFNTPNSPKIELYGLQLDAEVKPRNNEMKNTIYGGFGLKNKDFIKRSIFIDKSEVGKMITFIERDIIPHLKETYKEKSKEYVFKTKEMFFSFLINEKDARITMHITDFGPLGDGSGGGDQIEFWTETKIEDMPKFLNTIKAFYAQMK